MSGVIQPGEREQHSYKPGKTRLLGKVKRCTSKVKTRSLSSFLRRTPSSSDLEDSNKMSRQLASKTQAGKDRSPKGLMSGSPFNRPEVHEISSVHSSDASFRNRSLLSGGHDFPNDKSPSEHEFLPNKTGVSVLNISDPTQVFPDESGLVVPPQDAGDSLQGPSTVTSSTKGDTAAKTNESPRDSTTNIDQSKQDSSSNPNIIIDTSLNVLRDSDAPDQVPTMESSQDSYDQTKDEEGNEPDTIGYKPSDYKNYSWNEEQRVNLHKLHGCDLAFLPLMPSKEGSLDSEIMKIYHRCANAKDRFIREACNVVSYANRHKFFLHHEWYEWDYFNISDSTFS